MCVSVWGCGCVCLCGGVGVCEQVSVHACVCVCMCDILIQQLFVIPCHIPIQLPLYSDWRVRPGSGVTASLTKDPG